MQYTFQNLSTCRQRTFFSSESHSFCLYRKDERALPGDLRSRNFCPPPWNVVSDTTLYFLSSHSFVQSRRVVLEEKVLRDRIKLRNEDLNNFALVLHNGNMWYYRQIFRHGTAGKWIIMDGLSMQTVSEDENCLFRSVSIGLLLGDDGQFNR